MTLYNPILKEKIGVEFEFKSSLTSYLYDIIQSDLILAHDETGNTPEIRETAVDRVSLTTPAMRFEFKAGVYMAFKLIDDVILDSSHVTTGDKDNITTLVNLVSRYVGLEGEDGYHFMVAVFRVAEAISAALDNASPLMAPAPAQAPAPSEPQVVTPPSEPPAVVAPPEPQVVTPPSELDVVAQTETSPLDTPLL